MKILLDESLPRKLKKQFESEHEVWTVRDKGWLGQKNGDLIKLLTDNSFELFVTVDRNLRYQQNIERLPLTIVVLYAKNNRLETFTVLIPKLFKRLKQGNPQRYLDLSACVKHGFASTLADGIKSALVLLFGFSSGWTNHCSSFVHISGFGFAIELMLRLKEH